MSSSSLNGEGAMPWWANQGHQRALAMRNARLEKSRRGWSIVGCFVVTWMVFWIVGATYYILAWENEGETIRSIQGSGQSESRAGISGSIAHVSNEESGRGYLGPYDGFLPGCPRTGCKAFAVLNVALKACSALADCGGVTDVPFDDTHQRYQLRGPVISSEVRRTTDGQVSYVKENQRRPEEQLENAEEEAADDVLENEQIASNADRAEGHRKRAEENKDVDQQVNDIRFTFDDGESALDGPTIIDEPDPIDNPDGAAAFRVKFWQPLHRDEDAINAIGKVDGGQPTIFIGIASYRDPMCPDTIERALKWSKYPSRLRFGAVEQNAPIDASCFQPAVPCKQAPEQIVCKYRKNIRLHRVSARSARGPTFGRHRADSLYRGETYALQIDAHMYFAKYWDEDMISQFKATGNDNAVLSTYPTNFEEGNTLIEATGKPLTFTTPIICDSSFVGGNKMTKHKAANEFAPPKSLGGSPILSIWWAAGVSFSKGHRLVRVPYDGFLPMLFDGEETSMAYRMWTHGYDFYTFHHSLVFHPYDRVNRPPLFWENEEGHQEERESDLAQSEKRLLAVYGLLSVDDPDVDSREIDRFGLGKRRRIEHFWSLFGIDYEKQTVVNNCEASRSCAIHNALTPFLREDGKGIDYSNVAEKIKFKKAARRAKEKLGEYAMLSRAT